MKTLQIKGFTVLLDDEDYVRFSGIPFWLLGANYRRTGNAYFLHSFWKDGKNENRFLHRMILGLEDKGVFVDHINGNTLDNRKENLRVCSKSENMMNRGKQRNNTSGYKGVSFHTQRNRWRATIQVRGRQRHLGFYDTPEKAFEAYTEAAKEEHREFARTE